MRRISAKKLASLGGVVPFSTISSAPKKRIRKKPRSKSEFARIYGSKERREWVSWQPCVACDATGPEPRHNHHIVSGGTSRKAGYKTIVPLCADCHMELHDDGRDSFETKYRINLSNDADIIESRWLAAHPKKDAK